MKHTWILLATATSGLALTPSTADACGAPACWPGAFTPAEGASVPANVPGFFWRPQSGYLDEEPDPQQVTLAATNAPEPPIPLTATELGGGDWLLVPDQPLSPGVSYTLVDHNVCGLGSAGPASTFEVGPEAALPTSLPAPQITDHAPGALQVSTISGSCSADVLADQVTIELPLDAAALPWRDLLHFETRIDGAVWRASAAANLPVTPGESWAGRARDRVYTVCAGEDPYASGGLAPGTHEVTIRVTLPGTELVLDSPPATFVLDCEGLGNPDDPTNPGDPDEGGCSAGGQGSLLAALALATLRRRKRGTSAQSAMY